LRKIPGVCRLEEYRGQVNFKKRTERASKAKDFSNQIRCKDYLSILATEIFRPGMSLGILGRHRY
jgi:hypothetical protein